MRLTRIFLTLSAMFALGFVLGYGGTLVGWVVSLPAAAVIYGLGYIVGYSHCADAQENLEKPNL